MKSLATLLVVVAACTSPNPNYAADAGGDDLAGKACGRTCPNRSECTSGFCSAPTPIVGTQLGERCDASGGPQQLQCMASVMANLSCQPFVDPTGHEVRWFCDTSVGAGRGGTHCTRGNECRSGVCASGGTCFDACQQNLDCGGLTCRAVMIVVEGVALTAKSCAP
jgi:hypothetical protein